MASAGVVTKARKAVEAALRIARTEAVDLSQVKGIRAVRILLREAQQELDARLASIETIGAGPGSYSALSTRAAIEQVQATTMNLSRGLKVALLDSTRASATAATGNVIDHLTRMDKLFKGVGVQPIALDNARMFDRAVMGTESSLLRRLSSGQNAATPTGQGILERYGTAVISSFEDRLQMAAITRQPWADVRTAITKESPFLESAPSYWAERIVRTECMAGYNKGTFEATREADDTLGDVVKILCASFDNRTASDSYALHGQIRRPEEAFQWWKGLYQHPPNRPNDREVVVMHRISWPLPDELQPRSDAEVLARWKEEGRKGSPPSRPKMTTVPLHFFGAALPPTEQRNPRRGPQARQNAVEQLTKAVRIG